MIHKLEHELGGMFDVTHGAGLAAVWPSWARYVYGECLHRFARYARNVMGVTLDGTDEEVAEAGICAMEDFYRSIGISSIKGSMNQDLLRSYKASDRRNCPSMETGKPVLGTVPKFV